MDATVDPSIFEFSAKFCNNLDKTKNWVFSPPAIAEVTMAVMSLGGLGTADADDSNIIQIPKGNNIPSSYLLRSPKLNSVKGITLHQANKIYLKNKLYKLSRSQKNIVKEIFNVKIQNINFTKVHDAAKCINMWMRYFVLRTKIVTSYENDLATTPFYQNIRTEQLELSYEVEKKTNNRINHFLNTDDLAANTNLLLISGLYFKGIWQMKFDPEDTEEAIFHLNGSEIINVFLMYRKERYRYKYSEELYAQLVLIPFKNEEAHALVVLPKRVTGLDEVLQKLADGYDLMADVDQMSDVELIVKIESEINFNEVLQKLDINTKCDRAIKKVIIEVTEEGTERKPDRDNCEFIPRCRSRPQEFTADHPHLIVILCHNIPIIWVTFRGRFE